MVDPYDGAGDGDAQDVAEVFDEDNTNIESMRQGRQEDAEQFEDLVDVYDSTRADGDDADDGDQHRTLASVDIRVMTEDRGAHRAHQQGHRERGIHGGQ